MSAQGAESPKVRGYEDLATSTLVKIIAVIGEGWGQVDSIDYDADRAAAELNRRLPARPKRSKTKPRR